MASKRRLLADKRQLTRDEVRARIETPEMRKLVKKSAAKYVKYAVPIEELQSQLSRELGDRSLVQEIYAMREGR